MIDDPIVEEIHEIRRKMWKECGEDIEQFLDMIDRLESKDAIRISSVEELKAFMSSREHAAQEKQ